MTQERQAAEEEVEVRGLDPWGLRRVERLLHTVEGVDSLKIVPDGQGGVDEIHVLSASGLGAKQIVRNIESALLARFGLQVDHRKISIAQVSAQDLPAAEAFPGLEPRPEEEPAAAARRLALDAFHLERTSGDRVVCRVTLLDGEESFTGEAQGPDYAKSRLEATAQAALNAISRATDEETQLAIEGVAQVELFGREMAVAVVQGFRARRPTPLPGIAAVGDSVEEAVVLACLAATNRWVAER